MQSQTSECSEWLCLTNEESMKWAGLSQGHASELPGRTELYWETQCRVSAHVTCRGMLSVPLLPCTCVERYLDSVHWLSSRQAFEQHFLRKN